MTTAEQDLCMWAHEESQKGHSFVSVFAAHFNVVSPCIWIIVYDCIVV